MKCAKVARLNQHYHSLCHGAESPQTSRHHSSRASSVKCCNSRLHSVEHPAGACSGPRCLVVAEMPTPSDLRNHPILKAFGLQDHNRESQEHKKDRRGLQTGSTGPDAASKTSFEVMTPRARAVASAARAAACQVLMTPGGPLPSPAGWPGHADWHAAAAGNDVRMRVLPDGLQCNRVASLLYTLMAMLPFCGILGLPDSAFSPSL